MTERIERLVPYSTEAGLVGLQLLARIGPPGRLVRIIVGLLSRSLREAHRQARRGAVVAEQNVGDRVARLRSQEPGDEDRRRIAHRALQRQRAAVLEHHDRRLAHGRNRLGERLLRRGHDNLGTGLRLARHVLALADREQHDVGGASGSHRGLDPACERLLDAGSFDHRHQIGIAHGGADARRQIDGLLVVAIDDPGAVEVMLSRRERADDRDPLARLGQRQQVAVVLQKHDRFLRRLARQRQRRLGARARLLALHVDPAEGIVEQPEPRLGREHAAHRLVEPLHRHFALLDKIGKVIAVEAARHAHVDAGHEGDPRRVARIGREAMRDHLHIAGVIGDDEALEIPFAAQQLLHQPGIAGGRDARNLVERRHRG